jgi:iron complex outermembrane receptor protein
VIAFETLDGTLVTRGAETNVKLSYAYFKLFLGYTLTYADKENNGRTVKLPLIPTHRLNSVIMYEMEGRWRLGYEAYYTGSQRRRDGQKVRDYWIMGVMGERKWERFSVYVNFENFLDTRQSRYEKIIPPDNPSPTTDIWAPLEGFTINGGVKFRL